LMPGGFGTIFSEIVGKGNRNENKKFQ